MKKKYLQVFQQYKNSPPDHHGQEGLVHLWDLCIHIDTNTGFQFVNGKSVFSTKS